MKVLLVVPPFRTAARLVSALFPMPYHCVLLGAVLQEAGHEVHVEDFLLPRQEHAAVRPDSFADKHAPPYRHYGRPMDECLAWLDAHAPEYDVVGVAAGQCNLWETAAAIGQHVKSLGLPLVVGGPYATTATEECQARTGADVMVVGEGEGVVVQAVEQAVTGRQGVLRGAPVDLAGVPLPAWDLCPPADYPKTNGRVRCVVAVSRGCPHHCAFCSVHTIMGRKHRRLGVEDITRQLVHLAGFGVRYVCFMDDNLFINDAAVDALLAGIKEAQAQGHLVGVRFYAEEGIEVRMAAKPGMLKRLADAGFKDLALGVETMNNDRLKEQHKPYQPEQLRAAVAECKAAGLLPRAFYIVGFPGDTVDSVCRDLVEFGKLGLQARPNNMQVYPGTEITQQYLAAGYMEADYDWRLSAFHTPDSGTLTMRQVRRLKTVLGAIGNAALLGVRPFEDTVQEVLAAVATHGFTLHQPQADTITITGNLYRTAPLRHLLMLMLLRQGHAGATAVVNDDTITATALPAPKDEVQAAMYAAIHNVPAALVVGEREPVAPTWLCGDALEVVPGLEAGYDLFFTCPPYADLEQYSEDPRDLSNMSYPAFMDAWRRIVAAGCAKLRPNRFAVVVVGNTRDKAGAYHDFVGDTTRAFQEAGLCLYNEAMLITAVGSMPMRASYQFARGRKLTKGHQNVLVFYKGSLANMHDHWQPVADAEGGDV